MVSPKYQIKLLTISTSFADLNINSFFHSMVQRLLEADALVIIYSSDKLMFMISNVFSLDEEGCFECFSLKDSSKNFQFQLWLVNIEHFTGFPLFS